MAALVIARGFRSAVHRYFALTALSLLAWLVTLFLYARSQDPATVLWLGRANFAAIPLAVTFGYLFVAALARRLVPNTGYLLAGTALLSLITALTPLVDRSETVVPEAAGGHVTAYGPLFLPYLVFVAALLAGAVLLAFRAAREARHPERDQLLLVGSGILATGLVALVTNALLPFGFGDFRFVDVGTLSTIAFLGAVGYAILARRLFDIRWFVRKTLVYGLLLALVLAAYSAVLFLITERLAGDGKGALIRFSVLAIVFCFDPLKRFLEKKIDQFLFREGEEKRTDRELESRHPE